ncbi:MAG: acetyl-CoA C-acyltransferase [Bacteroidia bacterium]|nr:acetyl-CoA C-acyltransferase [Bacteroidia bacterium]
MNEVYILSAIRTPIGSFGGVLSSVPAPKLGAAAIKGALEKAGVEAIHVDEVFMGNVCSANLGQAPARQAALYAGLGYNVPCTTVNKVCASGMKSVMFAAQAIMLGQADLIVAGGMENMSQIPFYLANARYGYGYGSGQLIDGLERDGLTDVYNQKAMGVCGDNTAKAYNISREEQDQYAINSYKRAAKATDSGAFAEEIVPVEVPQRKGNPVFVSEDEEYKKVFFDKIPGLKPAFTSDGTVTAANASTLNDGASAIILASKKKVEELGVKPIARILGFADAEQEPEWFTTTPTLATPKALKRAGLALGDVDYFEVNEAFSVVALAYQQILKLDGDKINVHGGAVALGHPLGASGARILTTLTGVLRANDGEIGLATICNGGGGASAVVIQRM